MIRDLKILILMGLGTAALCIASAPVQASQFTVKEPETTLTLVKDGTGKAAHQVFEIRNAAGTVQRQLTCNEISTDGTLDGTGAESIAFSTPLLQGNCQLIGQEVTVQNTGCDFTYTAGSPQLHIVDDGANRCEHGQQPIHFETTNCKVEIGKQAIEGLKYNNLPDGTITVEASSPAFTYKATGADCPFGTTSNGLFTTGNIIVTGEEEGTGEMVDLEWDE